MNAMRSAIEFEQGAFTVDADVIAAALGIESERVQPLMRDGKITSVCERGVGEDVGRYRLTFLHANRAYHLIVDEEGHVTERSTRDVGSRRSPGPRSKRKPGV
jgi:hypothetical protein